MADRRWTILIVSSDNSGTRSITVSDRGRRAALWTVGTAVGLVLAATIFLFTPYATPGTRLMLAENERLRSDLDSLRGQIAAIGDTIGVIMDRDRQMRIVAGLADDTTGNADGAALHEGELSGSLDGRLDGARNERRIVGAFPAAPQRKPLLNRFGFARNPTLDELSQRASALAQSFRAVNDTLVRNIERLSNTPSIMPTTGWLSSNFSRSRLHPVLHESRPHEGIDVTAPMGAPIVAPASGIVRAVGFQAGYGNTFEVDHGNGIVTRYAHCSRVMVSNGQRVSRGQLLALVGNTGLTVGPHLHYEVHVDGKPVDPLRYVLPDKLVD
ncbi:MAG: hypothetical protein FJ202_12560 [Gemmatimonadetes bacterium]|nr:hypothetical protein [Gemmatimonadota bacterium]